MNGPQNAVSHGIGREWKSRAKLFGIPLVHVAYGTDDRGKIRVAKGFIAVGQFGVGAITFAQFGIGFIFGFGQFVAGLLVFGQFAAGLLLGVGQFSCGLFAIGQCVVGIYGLCWIGWARYMWSPDRVDMEAVAMFHTIQMKLRQLLGI